MLPFSFPHFIRVVIFFQFCPPIFNFDYSALFFFLSFFSLYFSKNPFFFNFLLFSSPFHSFVYPFFSRPLLCFHLLYILSIRSLHILSPFITLFFYALSNFRPLFFSPSPFLQLSLPSSLSFPSSLSISLSSPPSVHFTISPFLPLYFASFNLSVRSPFHLLSFPYYLSYSSFLLSLVCPLPLTFPTSNILSFPYVILSIRSPFRLLTLSPYYHSFLLLCFLYPSPPLSPLLFLASLISILSFSSSFLSILSSFRSLSFPASLFYIHSPCLILFFPYTLLSFLSPSLSILSSLHSLGFPSVLIFVFSPFHCLSAFHPPAFYFFPFPPPILFSVLSPF